MDVDDIAENWEAELENKPGYRGRSLMLLIIGLSIPAVCIWLWTRHSTGPGCETFINVPMLVFWFLFLLSAIFGIFICTSPFGLYGCMVEHMAFILLWAFLGYGIFILTVSSPGGGRSPPPDVGFQEYVLDDYSPWFQKRVNNTPRWNHLKKCLVKENVCHKFFDEYVNDTQEQFFARHLSPMESGCCKPPTNCNFNYTSALKWTKPKEWNQTNMDCNLWNEDPSTRCFNCQSCKAGFVDDVKQSWVIAGIAILVVFCLILYVSPCAACKGGLYVWEALDYGVAKIIKNTGGPQKEANEENVEELEESTHATPPLEVTDNNVEELGAREESTRPPRSLDITDNRIDNVV